MNSKQIAEYWGKTERTVQRWAKACNDAVSLGNDKNARGATRGKYEEYTDEEVVTIIRKGMGDHWAELFTKDLEGNLATMRGAVVAQRHDSQVDRLCSTVEKLCVLVASLIPSGAVKPAQIEAPKMTPRAELNRIIRAYAAQDEIGHGEVWDLLYIEAKYRLGVDLKLRAKHRQIMALDVAEELGLIPQLVAIAREMFA
jgi:hypothetical protein